MLFSGYGCDIIVSDSARVVLRVGPVERP
jgi:hypothetical protein